MTTQYERKQMTKEYVKVNHRLPQEVVDSFTKIGTDTLTRNAYIRVLRDNHWSLQSIADAVGGMTRERIRQIVEGSYSGSDTASAISAGLNLPTPMPPLKPVKEPKVYTEPSPETLARLLELQPLAQQVRSHSPRYRQEAEEYSALINHAYKVEGVSLYRLAKRLGVTHGSLRFRMARYGYLVGHNSASSCYKPILEKNRYVLHS
jgi:hypothetical protein